MNRAGLAIVLSMGVLTLLLWWLVNRPGNEPPWPAQIAGVSFSPIRGEQDPIVGKFPSIAEIDAALRRIELGTYGLDEETGEPIDPDRLDAIPTARTNIR